MTELKLKDEQSNKRHKMSSGTIAQNVESEYINLIREEDLEYALWSCSETSPSVKRKYPTTNCVWSQRILSDYKDFQKCGAPWGISAQIMDNDVSLWAVQILGPLSTPYEGGYFQGILQFSDLFPYHPPSFTFTTPIFHPNISESGNICVEQIYKKWSPCHTVWSFLISVQFVLADANTEDVLNPIAALYYATNRKQFEEVVSQVVESSRNDLKISENTFNNLIKSNERTEIQQDHSDRSCMGVNLDNLDDGIKHWKDRVHRRQINSLIYF